MKIILIEVGFEYVKNIMLGRLLLLMSGNNVNITNKFLTEISSNLGKDLIIISNIILIF